LELERPETTARDRSKLNGGYGYVNYHRLAAISDLQASRNYALQEARSIMPGFHRSRMAATPVLSGMAALCVKE
jgi:hypothetical protein